MAITEKFYGALVCPNTRESLVLSDGFLTSKSGNRYPARAEKINFLGETVTADFTAKRDLVDQVKSRVKRVLGKYYILLIYLVAPVCPRFHWRSGKLYWKWLIDTHLKEGDLVIQVGSGTSRISDHIINIDIFDFPEVDVVADCTKLPIADNSIDAVISMAVLEHVENPEDFIREAQRVLKPGGLIFTGVPFMQGFHASPSDYYRWTAQGLTSAHKRLGFDQVLVEPISGPTSGMIWILRDWLAIFFSFNLMPLYYPMLMLFTALLAPIKLLDLVLIHFKQGYKIASFNFYIGRKAS